MGAPCAPYLVVSGKAEVAVVPETFNVDLGRGEMRNKTNDAESGIKHATHPLHRLVQKKSCCADRLEFEDSKYVHIVLQ